MTGPFITLNTTVLYSLNTSSRATANYNPPPYSKGSGPGIPTAHDPWGQADGYAPQSISDTLVMYVDSKPGPFPSHRTTHNIRFTLFASKVNLVGYTALEGAFNMTHRANVAE